MLYVISPAKALDYETPLPAGLEAQATRPQFARQAAELIGLMRDKSAKQVAALMDLSPALAQLNVERYAAWSPRHTAHNSRPAIYAFDGDVYVGLEARTLAADDIAWAQQHLAILSGLYGVLRPLDLMQPYRLEMGTRLATERGADLYDFWGERITRALGKLVAGDPEPVLVNLASEEYFGAVRPKRLRARLVTPVFEDWHAPSGRHRVISFHAKKARGMMARHAIKRRLAGAEGLKAFDGGGYRFDAGASGADRWVFRRGQTDSTPT